HTLAAACAAYAAAPRLIEVSDDPCIDPAAHQIPGVRPFDFITDAHTACAEDAAIVIDHKTLMAGIHGQVRREIVIAHMVHACLGRACLQFTMTVHHTD